MTIDLSRSHRILAIGIILVVIAGLCVAYGGLGPNPDMGSYPDTGHLAEDYDAYLGEQAEVGGTVIETDPVVIEADAKGTTVTFVLEGAPSVERGQHVSVFATVHPDHLEVHDAVVRDAWERLYMYAVSLVGLLLAIGYGVRTWQIDWRQLQLRPSGDIDG